MIQAGEKLWRDKKVPVLIKGYKERGKVYDLFVSGFGKEWFVSRQKPGRFRGLGCALSSLIAAYLAMGKPLGGAVRLGRRSMGKIL